MGRAVVGVWQCWLTTWHDASPEAEGGIGAEKEIGTGQKCAEVVARWSHHSKVPCPYVETASGRWASDSPVRRSYGRTLQQEVKALLERAAETFTMREARRLSERWRHRLGGRSMSDSAQLIREDRDSRLVLRKSDRKRN
jgi:hypothetical protein